eukprot:754774-Hanusia_phi.AAC.4
MRHRSSQQAAEARLSLNSPRTPSLGRRGSPDRASADPSELVDVDPLSSPRSSDRVLRCVLLAVCWRRGLPGDCAARCLVCMDAAATISLLPCMHKCVCEGEEVVHPEHGDLRSVRALAVLPLLSVVQPSESLDVLVVRSSITHAVIRPDRDDGDLIDIHLSKSYERCSKPARVEITWRGNGRSEFIRLQSPSTSILTEGKKAKEHENKH